MTTSNTYNTYNTQKLLVDTLEYKRYWNNRLVELRKQRERLDNDITMIEEALRCQTCDNGTCTNGCMT